MVKELPVISQTAEYALRAAVFLADQAGRPLTTQEIADATRVPAGYLSKVLGLLARAGVVHSQRGLHGGFSLARKPEDLSVLDVINAVDPIQRINTCPLGLKAHGTELCPLHRRLDDAMASIEKAFGDSTLADLLADPSPSRPLCDVECLKK
jgi:Rrf2 family protein